MPPDGAPASVYRTHDLAEGLRIGQAVAWRVNSSLYSGDIEPEIRRNPERRIQYMNDMWCGALGGTWHFPVIVLDLTSVSPRKEDGEN